VGGRLWWLWVFATARTVVYTNQDGRGFDQAAAVLGAEFDGVLVRDGWAPYRQFDQAAHQTCLAQYADLRNMPIRRTAAVYGRPAG
jgi:hypothetical protein